MFDVANFLNTGTFIPDLGNDAIHSFLETENQAKYGEDGVFIYYFYYEGYSITFIFDETRKELIGQQLEISIIEDIKDHFILDILNYPSFKSKYPNKVDDTYCDDDELVVFMNSSVNLFFNKVGEKFVLSKATSKDEKTRVFVKKIMNKSNDH